MITRSRSMIIHSPPHQVFAYMDDIARSGIHMAKSSMPLMGGKLHLAILSPHLTGPGSSYRWTGKVLGFKIDFTVLVSRWVRDKEKVWETVGQTRLVILSWFRMHLVLDQRNDATAVELSISYTRPKHWFYKALSFLLADWYARWCLNNMLNDSKKALELLNKKVVNHESPLSGT